MNKYLKEYKWSNIFDMMRNNKNDPKVCNDSAKGKFTVISGTTSGIGYCAAVEYATKGSDLLFINRNEEKTIKLCNEFRDKYNIKCDYLICDYTSLDQVKDLGLKLSKIEQNIDVFIHNAGTYLTTKQFTKDNIETVFQVNYLSSFILNYMLKDKFAKQKQTKILFVNSEGHRFALSGVLIDDLDWKKHHYTGLKGYGNAKTAQILSMTTLSKYYEGLNITINSMHPGNVKSNMGENNGKLYRIFKHLLVLPSSRPPEIAGKALYYLGISKEVEKDNGYFFNLTEKEIPAPHALDKEMAFKLWDKSISLSGLK
ncbi:MAG: SDR family NAD(P)-dependent oxidoreductase [Pleomorphochaeta sp.]